MDQKPIGVERPLDPPTPDVARSYLDEAAAVERRREERIDRRGIALVSLVECVVLAAYLTMMMFGFGTAGAGVSFLGLVGLFLFWIQLSVEWRETYGLQPRLRIQQGWTRVAFVVLVVVIILVGVILQVGGVELPLVLRFAPGMLVIAVFGALAVRDLRRAGGWPPPAARTPLTTSGRIATVAIGVLVGAAIWMTAAGDALVISAFGMAMMLVLLGWWVATQVSDKLPALGAVWRWPHWGAFMTGWGVLAAVVLLQSHTAEVSVAFAAVAAVAVAVLFAGAAFLDGREDALTAPAVDETSWRGA